MHTLVVFRCGKDCLPGNASVEDMICFFGHARPVSIGHKTIIDFVYTSCQHRVLVLDRVKERANEIDIPYQSLIKQYINKGLQSL